MVKSNVKLTPPCASQCISWLPEIRQLIDVLRTDSVTFAPTVLQKGTSCCSTVILFSLRNLVVMPSRLRMEFQNHCVTRSCWPGISKIPQVSTAWGYFLAVEYAAFGLILA